MGIGNLGTMQTTANHYTGCSQTPYTILYIEFKILCRTLTTYSTLCWLLVPTVLPEGCSESAKENRKITGCTRAAQASELSQAEIQLNEIGCKISNSCFQALPTKEGESLE